MTIRVLIADHQDIVRTGLATILRSQPDIDVIGQAADGREAVALALRLRPDVCLRRPGAGAKGFLLKDAGPDLLLQALRAAAEGDALIAPSVTTRLLASFAEKASSSNPTQPLVPLTGCEEEVLVTVARGRTNAVIADELHISLSTVKFHLASLLNKIGARNRVEIAIWAHESKRVRP